MKIALFAIAFITAAGFAHAGDEQSPLSAVTVRPSASAAKAPAPKLTLDCAPPNSTQACAAFHAEIRRNFSSREIGMLFGAATAYPEYRSAYPKVVARYDSFVHNYDQRNLTAFAGK
jgi:hypothetical protein